MIVALVGRVRERLGGDLAVAEFSRRPTFGALVELTSQRPLRPPTSAAGLMTLRHGDESRPVFLVADAMGTTASYRVLAGLVNTSRALYGLDQEAPSSGGGRTSITRIAARHVEAMRQVDADGPYTICGWSFGAVVAHEMAAQLIAAGSQVEVLVAIDGFPPPTRGLPIAVRPGYLAGNLRLALAVRLGRGPAGVGRTPQARARFAANIRALLAYRPRPLPCRAVVLPARGTADGELVAARVRRRLGAVYERAEVWPVAGNHWSMLAEPDAGDLAARLSSALESPVTSPPEAFRR